MPSTITPGTGPERCSLSYIGLSRARLTALLAGWTHAAPAPASRLLRPALGRAQRYAHRTSPLRPSGGEQQSVGEAGCPAPRLLSAPLPARWDGHVSMPCPCRVRACARNDAKTGFEREGVCVLLIVPTVGRVRACPTALPTIIPKRCSQNSQSSPVA